MDSPKTPYFVPFLAYEGKYLHHSENQKENRRAHEASLFLTTNKKSNIIELSFDLLRFCRLQESYRISTFLLWWNSEPGLGFLDSAGLKLVCLLAVSLIPKLVCLETLEPNWFANRGWASGIVPKRCNFGKELVNFGTSCLNGTFN